MAGTRIAKANDLKIGRGLFSYIVLYFGLCFLLFPILVLIVFSFNDSRFITSWGGFSLKWYKVLSSDRALWAAVKNSLLIAFVNTVSSTILGTMAALVLGKYAFRGKKICQNLLYIPMIIPEIILGISFLIFFVIIRLPLGIVSVIISHITFSISFVTLVVLTKIYQFDKGIEEASLDLGANRWQTFFKVVLPLIAPGIVSGALLAFTLSIDDFIITFFTAGVGSTTLPIKIYSMIKFGITPEINAISAILIVFTISLVLTGNLIIKLYKKKDKIKY